MEYYSALNRKEIMTHAITQKKANQKLKYI